MNNVRIQKLTKPGDYSAETLTTIRHYVSRRIREQFPKSNATCALRLEAGKFQLVSLRSNLEIDRALIAYIQTRWPLTSASTLPTLPEGESCPTPNPE